MKAKIFLFSILFVLATAVIGFVVLRLRLHEKEPQGMEGAEAQRLTEQVYTSLNKPAWDSTDWVRWTFRGDHHYLWDKRNNRLQAQWGDISVEMDLHSQQGQVKKGGKLLQGSRAARLLKKAYANFCNDSFWLAAPYKLTDPGTQRSVVTLADGRKGLKVSYSSGGVTPGDSYVWILDDSGTPVAFKMWVAILPIGGLEASWEQWITLPTGARLSSYHLLAGKIGSRVEAIDGGRGEAPVLQPAASSKVSS
jgi:hypothetical protein